MDECQVHLFGTNSAYNLSHLFQRRLIMYLWVSHVPVRNRHASLAPLIQSARIEVDTHNGIFSPQKVFHQPTAIITQFY